MHSAPGVVDPLHSLPTKQHQLCKFFHKETSRKCVQMFSWVLPAAAAPLVAGVPSWGIAHPSSKLLQWSCVGGGMFCRLPLHGCCLPAKLPPVESEQTPGTFVSCDKYGIMVCRPFCGFSLHSLCLPGSQRYGYYFGTCPCFELIALFFFLQDAQLLSFSRSVSLSSPLSLSLILFLFLANLSDTFVGAAELELSYPTAQT